MAGIVGSGDHVPAALGAASMKRSKIIGQLKSELAQVEAASADLASGLGGQDVFDNAVRVDGYWHGGIICGAGCFCGGAAGSVGRGARK